MFRNILVAVDGSTHADEALAQAIDLADSEHARLTLIAGVTGLPPAACVGLSGPAFAVMQADARSLAEAVLRRARDRVPDDLPVTTILTDEPIRPALIKQIKRGGHDLIAMGSRGRGAMRAALLGSVSHYILHHTSIPVLIIHARKAREQRTRERRSRDRAPARRRATIMTREALRGDEERRRARLLSSTALKRSPKLSLVAFYLRAATGSRTSRRPRRAAPR
jgi:nucleotide-binding universal stress UspA family protein